VVEPKDSVGFLTDGITQTQKWTVVPDSHRISQRNRFSYKIADTEIKYLKRVRKTPWDAESFAEYKDGKEIGK